MNELFTAAGAVDDEELAATDAQGDTTEGGDALDAEEVGLVDVVHGDDQRVVLPLVLVQLDEGRHVAAAVVAILGPVPVRLLHHAHVILLPVAFGSSFFRIGRLRVGGR